jgi:hypothetical protein
VTHEVQRSFTHGGNSSTHIRNCKISLRIKINESHPLCFFGEILPLHGVSKCVLHGRQLLRGYELNRSSASYDGSALGLCGLADIQII